MRVENSMRPDVVASPDVVTGAMACTHTAAVRPEPGDVLGSCMLTRSKTPRARAWLSTAANRPVMSIGYAAGGVVWVWGASQAAASAKAVETATSTKSETT